MVKLVDYSQSSDDALDTRSNDGSQWSSFGEIPSSPSDSFSYPMESLDSEEEDEDYVPSRTSLDVSGSVTSSVDTDDLNPDNDMDEEVLEEEENCNFDNFDKHEDVKNVKNVKNDEVFYAWKDLQTAFEINAFKKRSVDTLNNMNVHKVPDQKTEVTNDDEVKIKSNYLDKETEKSSFSASFAPGIAEKKTIRPHRRKMQTKTHKTGVSPRFSTLFTGKQQQYYFSMTKDTIIDCFSMQNAESNTEKETKPLQVNGQTNQTAFGSFQPLQVDTPTFSFGAKQKTPDFTFGKPGAAVIGEPSDDTHMHSPSPKRTAAAASFVPVEGGFTLGQSGKNPKPYKFYNFGNSGSEAVSFSMKVPNMTKDGDDACMRSPCAHDKRASRNSTTGKFLFGQAYKNRKPHAFSRQKCNESLDSTESVFTPIVAPPTGVSGVLWGIKDPIGDTSSGSFGANCAPTAPSTSFSTGVAGPNMQHRNADRRKKKSSLCSTFAPISESNSSRSQFFASSSTFGSPLSQSATATYQQSNTTFAGGNAHEGSVQSSNMASAVPAKKPFVTSTGGSFEFGNSNAKTSPEAFPNTDSSSFRADGFGSATTSAAPATSSAGVYGQVSRDEGTTCNPFEFGGAETNMPTEGAKSQFSADNMSSATTGTFQIGSHDARKNPRVRPRRSGMFTHKNSPRKDAKVGATEPEPSPGFGSASSSTPSPFGMHHRRTRKNARLRKCGRSPPADQSAKRTFQCDWSSPPSDEQLHSHTVKPTATTGFGSTIGANSTSNNYFGVGTAQQQDQCSQSSDPGVFSSHSQPATSSTSQPQKLNQPSIFRQNGPSKSAQIQQTSNGGKRPAYAGSRRILRAALRSVGVSGDRPGSASPTMSSRPRDIGDAEMDSDDEQDWFELKRLGGVAYASKKYEDAAEYYRQSIERLESLPDDDTVMYTTEMRADKAKLHANRAASLMMLMQIAEAQRECRRSIEVDATYARAYLRLGRIQVLLGDAANAQANIDTARLLMEGPDNKVSSGDEADYASLTKMEAKIKKLTTLQGEIKWYVDYGDFKQALVQTNFALTLAPNSRKLQVEKARILLRQKKLDQVVKFCSSIIEKQQASQGKMSSPARTSGANTKPLKDKTAEKIAMIGIELGLLWATTLHYQNKADDAVQILDALEVVAPCSSHVIQLKRQWQDMKQLKHDGNERFKQGNYQEAVRFYSEAVQIDPQHQEYCAIIYCNRSAAQMGLERYHTAVLDCNEALKRKPNFPRALLRRARCHVALKIYHEAVKDFERYLREQPGTVGVDATSDVRRECNEAKAAISKAREEVRQREAAKKRAERQQRQQRQQYSHQWEDSWQNDSKSHGNFRRGASSNNGGGQGSSRFQSSGGSSRASYMAPKTQRRTHYDVLGIEKTSTVNQIRKAYRKLALVYHPDKAKTSAHGDLFKEMTAAYNVLSDESARAKYDRELIYNRFGNFYES